MADNTQVIGEQGTAAVKPTVPGANEQAAAAPVDKPVVDGEAAPEIDGEDIDNLITILNEVDTAFDGKGGIKGIPEELKPVIKTIIEQMVGFREAFEDPLFKSILDDLLDQRTDGQTPSVLVAIARTIPFEELKQLDEGGDEGAIQDAVKGRVASEKQLFDDEVQFELKVEESLKNLEAYCDKMGYEGEAREEYKSDCMTLFEMFGDGVLDEGEFADIDRMRNYESDMEALKGQIPEAPKKEVIPDKASVEAQMTQTPQKQSGPRNMIETFGATMPGANSFLETGKRKVYGK